MNNKKNNPIGKKRQQITLWIVKKKNLKIKIIVIIKCNKYLIINNEKKKTITFVWKTKIVEG